MSYLFKCKELLIKGITPSNPIHYQTKEYSELISIANNQIEKLGIELFSSYFQEVQYLVNLWTAHILFDKKGIPNQIREECVSIITLYSSTPLDSSQANEEKNWLILNVLNK